MLDLCLPESSKLQEHWVKLRKIWDEQNNRRLTEQSVIEHVKKVTTEYMLLDEGAVQRKLKSLQ
jgi:hypothetical protein